MVIIILRCREKIVLYNGDDTLKNFVIKGDVCYSTSTTTINTIKDGFVVCENGISKGVFENLPKKCNGYELFDYSGKLVIPAMVDLHTHAVAVLSKKRQNTVIWFTLKKLTEFLPMHSKTLSQPERVFLLHSTKMQQKH